MFGIYYNQSNALDIYDDGTNSWMKTACPSVTTSYAAAALDTLILFAGSSNTSDNAVDIYDTVTKSWTTSNVVIPSSAGLSTAAATNGHVLFAGRRAVYIYSTSARTWTNHNLSVARTGVVAAASNNKILFAGGRVFVDLGRGEAYRYYALVDIYDVTTDSWTTANLSAPRHEAAAAADSGVIVFAGGSFASKVVDFYDTNTDMWHNATISVARSGAAAAAINGKVYIAGGADANGVTSVVDVCDLTTFTSTPMPTRSPSRSAAMGTATPLFSLWIGLVATIIASVFLV